LRATCRGQLVTTFSDTHAPVAGGLSSAVWMLSAAMCKLRILPTSRSQQADMLAMVLAVRCGAWRGSTTLVAVARSPHRPQSAIGKSATILGLYLVAALVAALVPFARPLSGWSIYLSGAALVLAFVVGQQLVWYNGWIQIGGVIAASVLVFPAGLAAPSSVLRLHGDRVTAVVVDVVGNGSYRSRTYQYTLAADGRPIPGHLVTTSDDYPIGSEVAVVVDRHGHVDPKTTGEVDTVGPLWLTAGVGLMLTAALSALGGRGSGSGRPPRRGPLGIWIFDR
jgi:hypothetical protein